MGLAAVLRVQIAQRQSAFIAKWHFKDMAAPRSRIGFVLYAAPDQLESHVARMVVAYKVTHCEVRLVDPLHPSEDLAQLNPYNSTPTLADRDVVLYDVAVLAEYLDERFPHSPLLPADPVARARARLGVVRIRRDWFSLAEKIESGTPTERNQARKRLREELIAADAVFRAAKFFLSDEFSLLDCFLTPLLWRLDRYGVELPESCEALRNYRHKLSNAPSFLRTLKPR